MATTATEVPQAEVRLTEALDLSPLAHKRMVGSERFVVAYQAIGLLAGIFLGTLLAGFVPLAFIWGGWLVPTWLPLQAAHLILGIFGWGMGLATAQRRRRERFVAGIQRRGTPDSVPASYAIEPACA